MWHSKPLPFLILGIVAEHLCLIHYAEISAATHGLMPLGFTALAAATLLLLLFSVLLRRHRRVAGVAILSAITCVGMLTMEHQSHHLRYSATMHRYYERQPSEGLSATIAHHATAVRERLMKEYERHGLEGDALAITAAMTLGERSGVTKELREVYNISGGAHVFALSGLHLGIIFMFLTFLLPTFRHPKLSHIISIAFVWCYVLMVGAHASVVRAAVMLTLYSIGRLLAHHSRSIDVTTAAALLMLAVKPHWLFDVGFQMSFLSVISIALLYERILYQLSRLVANPLYTKEYLRQITEQQIFTREMVGLLWRVIVSFLTLSFAAQIGAAPLVAFYFHRFSCYFWLTNFFISPATLLIIMLAFLLLIASLLLPASFTVVGDIIAWMLKTMVNLQNSLLEWVASLPGASIENIHISPVQLLLIYIIITATIILIRRVYSVILTKKLGKMN